MNEQKKKVILGEIEYWRQSHLLPSHYCDFLLNLYTEGEKDSMDGGGRASKVTKEAGSESLSAFSFPRLERKWAVTILSVIVLLYLVFHFTDFTITMQMTMLSILTIGLYILAFIGKEDRLSKHIFLGAASILLALSGLYFLKYQGYSATVIIGFLVIVCCLWVATGLAANKRYISFSGLLGLQAIYGWITYRRLIDDFAWWRVECFWIPIAIVLVVLGLIWNRRKGETAALFFFNGIIGLFGSEIACFFLGQASKDVLLYSLYIKIIFVAFFLRSLKNLWWRWVSKQQALR
ncbi:hypothetical protein [Aneurinibacillus terranovensis]|uniref:hypothetical protein n=1 Tax=Aneurinibacillus terranovensis TaxID=278991 RepID=UPI0003FB7E23|nr:hypothetical protein [Aneurinibacillus terranovensis]